MTPIRNGGDLYIWRKWGALDPQRFDARLYAADGVYLLRDGGWTSVVKTGRPTLRSRPAALVAAMLGGSDYLSAKYNTADYVELVRKEAPPRADLTVYSYASTYLLLASVRASAGGNELVETHNYDTKFYLDRAAEARGLMRGMACLAAGRSHAMLGRLPRHVPLVALGETDARLFRALGHERVVVSGLGYDRRPPRAVFPAVDALSIAFVGSLSVAMNATAILAFAERALPRLRAALQRKLEVHVAGSRPSPALVGALKRHGVQVHADLADEDLTRLIQECHATILPFDSSNGLKLKFALSAGAGVPVLSYIDPPPELDDTSAVLTSRDMGEWAAFLARV
ncbi:MAG: hypothetical protein ACXWC6_13985, partial [Ramlibacter sp.]